MLRNASVRVDNLQELMTTTSGFIPYEDDLLIQNSKKVEKNDISITSIIAKHSTINHVLKKKVDYNEDIYIFEITGKTYSSTLVSWKIYKNYIQIKDLFEQLKIELSERETVDENIIIKCKVVNHYSKDEILKNLDKISDYIANIYNRTNPNHPESLKEWLRISKSSFGDNVGIKPFEGYAYKKAEPRNMRKVLNVFGLDNLFYDGWNRRWFILKKDMISYLNSPNILISKNVYWFDEEIDIVPEKDEILTITNLSRSLTIKFDSRFERDLWEKEINKRVELKKEEIMSNMYHSFTTLKNNCGAKWFVDGSSYFSYLFEQLKNAKESVYITDWFMSPEIALVRPISYDKFLDEKNDYKRTLNFSNVSRLMDILYLLAKKGVKIYILLFCEVKLALGINSLYAKNVLKNLHNNIKITRHPKGTSSILWSHHEKLVIIDQKIAFVGGLDLCWGRYDTNKHPIVEEENEKHEYYYPGSDYINERQVDLHEVEKFYIEQINRKEKPRMAWHDVHTMVEGPIVSDIARHFVERWNDARFEKRNNGLVNNTGLKNEIKTNKKISTYKKAYELENNINNQNDIDLFQRTTITMKPKDIKLINKYNNNNIIMNNIEEEKADEDDEDEEFDEDDEDEDEIEEIINKTNDKIKNNNNNLNQINDIERKEKKNDFLDDFVILDKQGHEINIKNNNISKNNNKSSTNNNKPSINKLNLPNDKVKDYKSKPHKRKNMKIKQKAFLSNDYEQKDQSIKMDFKVQALRSACQWSIGKTMTEHSILEGYYKLIDNAKHYIYIENQFFITKSYSEDERKMNSNLNLNRLVENEIGLHIRARIERAYDENSNFKVFICIPLLPGFSGVPGESSTMNCILKHTYQSIARNKGMSLLEILRKKMGDNINKYIYFFSLRNHGTIKDIPVTELVYIHSKLLIVDDEKVLIGSANINDRSMTGYRDSEFAVIIEENQKVESIMDNKKYSASNYALTLRKHLMAEHLGLNIDDKLLDDPLNNNLWNHIRSKANVNSSIYSFIFDCYPDNKFNKFSKLKERKLFKTEKEKEKLKKDYKNNKIGIVGHIVEYPIEFLKDEELDIDFFSKENLVPEKNFV